MFFVIVMVKLLEMFGIMFIFEFLFLVMMKLFFWCSRSVARPKWVWIL